MKIFILLLICLHITCTTAIADGTVYKWTGLNDEFCTAIATDGKTESVDRKQCLIKAPVIYAWSNLEQKKCGVYTPNNIFVAATEAANCEEQVKSECSHAIETVDTNLRTFIDGMLYKIIPEILTLKNGEAIPGKIIMEKDSRVVAASLIARLTEEDVPKKNSKEEQENIYDFYKDSEIQMSFNDKNFDKIRKGCFRNQFQTNSTNGSDARALRQKAEMDLMGVKIDGDKDILEEPSDPSHNIRPKYAYFVPTKPMKSGYGHSYVDMYGNVFAVLKDEIKDRSTFTAYDSLGMGEKGKILDSKQDYTKLRTYGGTYWETQVWGDVCFSDVQHFLVNCPSAYNDIWAGSNATIEIINKISDEALEQMKETGIPVYQCVKEKRGDNVVYTKGNLLSSEDNLKRKTDETKANAHSNFPERRIDPALAYKIKYEEYLKTPEGIKAKAEMEAYYKTPEGIKAKAAYDEALKSGSPYGTGMGMYPGTGGYYGGFPSSETPDIIATPASGFGF